MGDNEKKEEEKSDIEAMSVIEPKKRPYPKHVVFILGNEFCERYCYYGMRTILILYLTQYLFMDEDGATAVYHAFTVLAYLFPLMGAFIADSWLGKYRTILYLSIVYAIGMVLITLGAVWTLGAQTLHMVLSMVGLFVIAVGTGGIKPCVSAFGGDQFHADQEDNRRSFFSLFYFAINAGSLISTIVSPIIRGPWLFRDIIAILVQKESQTVFVFLWYFTDDVNCFGRDDCFALAFGIPAALMVVAIIAFVVGTPFYIMKKPKGNIFAEVFRAMGSAIKHRWNTPRKQRNKEHWMDYALVDTSEKMVRDTKYVLRVLLLFVPLPFFWALFDQQGSRWTLQATRMDGQVGAIRVKPDQMQVFNPLLIVTLIPLFEATLYPCLRHYNLNFSPLRKMTVGQILAGISFILAALVQLQMDETLTVVPEGDQASVRIINSASCNLLIHSDIYPSWDQLELSPGEATDSLEMFISGGRNVSVEYHCPEYTTEMTVVNQKIRKATTNNIIISDKTQDTLQHKWFEGLVKKSDGGGAIFRVFNTYDEEFYVKLGAELNCPKTDAKYLTTRNNISEAFDEDPNTYTVTIFNNKTCEKIVSKSFNFEGGAVYTLVASTDQSDEKNVTMYEDVAPNVVNLFWMIPQYFVITLGEVFLSVTGLEFSYTQAPPSMKSVLTSFWLLTVSAGNIIVIIIAEAKFVPNQADEYFLFAGLIFAATILFVILAVRYDYVDESEFVEIGDPIVGADSTRRPSISDDEEEKKPPDSPGKGGHVNDGFDTNQESTAL